MSRALMLHDDVPRARLTTLADTDLPTRDVLVEIDYSDLNYKDALAVTGKGKVVRELPFVPGIDFAGTVRESRDERYRAGERVLLTGWGVGERYWGGYAEAMRVDGDWLVPCPEPLSSRKAMLLGTAGLTAMLCILRLEEAGLPAGAEVLVTGASGGVGSWTLAILDHLGYAPHAVSGKSEQRDWLEALGAREVHSRADFEGLPRPLEKGRWTGAVDTVGGTTLANLLAHMDYDGRVAAVGLAGGIELPTTVMPFILRGVSLLGTDSVMIPFERRRAAWQRLASLPSGLFERMAVDEIGLEQIAERAATMLEGKIHGRVLIDVRR